MRGFKQWVMRLSIRGKLVYYSYLTITPILLVISVILFLYNYGTAVKSEEAGYMWDVRNVSDSIEVIQQDIMDMGTYICINEQIGQILTADEPAVLNRDAQLWTNHAPMQMIQDMIAIGGYVKTIAIYPENGVNPYLRCMDYSAYIAEIEKVRDESIYELAVQSPGKYLWQRTGKYLSDTYLYNQNDKIVMYREIYDVARKNQLGYLVIGASAEMFDEICTKALQDKKGSIIVLSEYGAELVACGDVDSNTVSQIVKAQSGQEISKEAVDRAEYNGYHIYSCKSRETGTIVHWITPKVGIADFVDSIIYAPLALLLGFLVGLYPVMVLVSNIVSKPLRSLRAAMEKFKNGDFSQQVEVMTQDEVGEASACFNSMVEDIRKLIDENYVMALKERESELDILQAQINPHFLYNTLDTLYWKAIDVGAEEIAEDIISLSQLFRLVLNRGSGIVPVRNEVELLERYLHIQKMRFGKRLEYEITVDKAIMDEEIPKLILQPFVENAIVHGFEKGDSNFRLSVIGEKTDKSMVFYIRDTGIGMSREQVESIWEEKDERKHSGQHIGKYAIRNVKERLELTYHGEYELWVESEEGKGTTVKIAVPCGVKEM